MKRIVSPLASAVTAALLFSACGSSGSDGIQSSSAESEMSLEEMWSSSPIAGFLGQDIDWNSDEGRDQIMARQREVNDLVVACMAAEGFEWRPDPIDEATMFGVQSDDEPEWGSQEWVDRYGFGITTQRYEQSVVGPDLIGANYSMGMDHEYVDPNEDYVQSLSEAELAAYYEVLYGSDSGIEWDETLSDEENSARIDEFYADYVPTGCMNTAWAQVDDNQRSNEFYQDFGDELERLYAQVESDPRVVQFQQQARECVTAKGMQYATEEEVWMLWDEELMALESEHIQYPGQDLTEQDWERITDEELEALYQQPTVMSEEGKAILAELQKQELEMAKVYTECGADQVSAMRVRFEVQVELEQQFLDDNADRLASYGD